MTTIPQSGPDSGDRPYDHEGIDAVESPPAPETIVQRPPALPSEPEAPPTISQRPVQGTDSSASASRSAPFPDGLRGEYEPVEVVGDGFESIVWHARRRADGTSVAVKVYWIGKSIDHRVLDVLRRPEFRRYAPRIDAVGRETTERGVHEWIVMEYLPTSLAHVIRDERAEPAGLPLDRARALLSEIAELLDFWYEKGGLIPTDVKPDNFALRRGAGGAPDELVLCDFGGTARDTATAAIAANGEILAARAYLAPEALAGTFHPASPFWSLGHIGYEMVTGSPYFRVDEQKRTVLQSLATAEPDLSAVPDDTWRLLLAGLFTRHPDDRWRATEVRRWLAGDRPDVIRPAAPGKRAPTPMQFHTTTHRSPGTLAEALLEKSAEGAQWMQSEGGRLADWLEKHDLAGDFDVELLRRDRTGLGPELVLQFGAVHAPDARPACYGHPVDVDGLSRLCDDADAGPRVLALLLGSQGKALLPHAARFRCAHRRCCPHPDPAEGERGCGCQCMRLLDVADAAPGIITEARKIVAETARSQNPLIGSGARVEAAERTLYGTTVGLTLGLLSARDVLGDTLWLRAKAAGPRGLPGPQQWAELSARAARAGQSVNDRAAITAVAVLGPTMTLTTGPNGADRLRKVGPYRLRAALVTLLVLLMAAWSGAVFVRLVTGKINPFPTELAADTSEQLGTAALTRVTTLLPVLLLAAILAGMLPRRAASAVFTFTGLAFLLGWLLDPLPMLDERTWAPDALAHVMGNWTGLAGCLIAPVAALFLATVAASMLAGEKAGLGDRPSAARERLRAQVRSRGGVVVMLIALNMLLWSTVVLGDVFAAGFPFSGNAGDPVDSSAVGRYAARSAIAYLPYLALGALVVGLLLRRRRDATGPIQIAVAITVLVGLSALWVPAEIREHVPDLESPTLSDLAAGLGDLGDATWWWAVVLVPAVHTVLAVIRRND
ncbi:hypothetical protein E1200_04115 [Actinomadura sp. GC306]|uniref:protein kinase domain-containing protein n=1 Tax=Actinomadura sp. GC306 TaxID=2530367 RepID=UPI0010496238|nr:hypothetical protein [Actinomadura sp. GC306]TDC70799.1 hypothetical protein E1200_04115 [Actinomadura sp. GC306]